LPGVIDELKKLTYNGSFSYEILDEVVAGESFIDVIFALVQREDLPWDPLNAARALRSWP
jgi:hypothetical protein